ncbi:hypothetical protein [uncultured Dysosmobacter sp.]|uniref:hypothetical protein n=1 Tax=uncultured Dysosmobacter sp. TaxID=2591384 RepID=UPI0026048BCD|nr:hypothetical protein [uncultured Dysosmobacter sp.]
MSYKRSFRQNDLEAFKIGGQPGTLYDTIAPFLDVPAVKGGGSVYGGSWQPAKPGDERFLGEPGQTISSHAPGRHGGYDRDTKIGDDGRAASERHYTDHGRPDLHTDPHDHIIDWSTGHPIPGPPINYPNGAPEFKWFGGIRKMSYDIGTNSLEDNRFKSISDFKWCVNCGGEVEFEWRGKSFGIWPKLRKTPDAPLQMLISQIYIDDPASTEKWCDTADELLEYMVGDDRLRDVITQVIVWERTI